MSDRFIRVVSLWIHPGQEAAFENFEREAARLMARHGGRIDRAIRVTEQRANGPYEVHLVSFPNRAAADSYVNDPETAELRKNRAAIIVRTEFLDGQEAGPY